MKKRIILTLLFFISLVFVSTKFAAVGFIKDSSKSEKDQPIYFKISPVFWLPAYLKYGEVVSDPQILPSLAFTVPYWIIISFIISCLIYLLPPLTAKTRAESERLRGGNPKGEGDIKEL
jgi:hypothetical protein